jgi:hypothetical protein
VILWQLTSSSGPWVSERKCANTYAVTFSLFHSPYFYLLTDLNFYYFIIGMQFVNVGMQLRWCCMVCMLCCEESCN